MLTVPQTADLQITSRYALSHDKPVTEELYYTGRVRQRLCCHLAVLMYLMLRSQHWLNPRSLGTRQAPTKVLPQAARAKRREPGLAEGQTSICLRSSL